MAMAMAIKANAANDSAVNFQLSIFNFKFSMPFPGSR
jgi:hypothetical protein